MSSISGLRAQLTLWTRVIEDKNDELAARQKQVEALEQMCRGMMHLTLNALDVAKGCEGLFKDKCDEFPLIPRKSLIEEEVSDLMPQMVTIFSALTAALSGLNSDAVDNEESLRAFSVLMSASAAQSKKEDRTTNLTPVLPADFLLEAANRADTIRLRTVRRVSAASSANGDSMTTPSPRSRVKGKAKKTDSDVTPSASSAGSVQSIQALLTSRESDN